MIKKPNKFLYNKRLKILKYAKTIIADHGLTSNTFKKISDKYDIEITEIEFLFPNGKNNLLEFILEELNKNLEEYCKKIDLIRLPVHKRIRKILLSKIYIMNKEKKFYKKIFLSLLLTNKKFSIPSYLYKSIDQIWFISGDTSVDFNFYSKRIILATIYSRVILFFFNNDNQQELENLLDKNLKRVKKIPELKSKLNIIRDNLPNIVKLVKNYI